MVVQNINDNWGLYGAIAGICGGFLAGWSSDKFFHSRRAPVALLGNVLMLVCVVVIFFSIQTTSAMGAGLAAMLIMLGCISVHSILSGTATADFGGRNGAATATGVADGFSKIGTSFQEISIGFLISSAGWNAWPMFLFPFTVIAIIISWRLWNVLPDATKKYLRDVEKVEIGAAKSAPGATFSPSGRTT
jgi:OPA family glycerol-3-phosphate transporter-like MFS transporter